MKSFFNEPVSMDEVRAMIKKARKKDNSWIFFVLAIVLGLAVIAAAAVFIVKKVGEKHCDCCDDDFDDDDFDEDDFDEDDFDEDDFEDDEIQDCDNDDSEHENN